MEGLTSLHPVLMFEEWLDKVGIEPPEHKVQKECFYFAIVTECLIISMF
jgi:hypothetical protein